jgi:hypothetical protein
MKPMVSTNEVILFHSSNKEECLRLPLMIFIEISEDIQKQEPHPGLQRTATKYVA